MISHAVGKYELVKPEEYNPKRQSFEAKILKKAKRFIELNYHYTFEYDLIGSAGRGLVTRLVDGNEGYDFDYNLILRSMDSFTEGGITYVCNRQNFGHISPRTIKEQFRSAFNHAVEGTEFDYPEDSSAVLTIKCKDRKNSRILYGADLAIVYYDNEGVMHSLMHHKPVHSWDNDGYGFDVRNRASDVDDKLDEILECLDNGWDLVEKQYLKLKNNNKDPEKRSFDLYVEAVSNIRNNHRDEIERKLNSRVPYDEDEDDNDDDDE
jgi:hypothetical protein